MGCERISAICCRHLSSVLASHTTCGVTHLSDCNKIHVTTHSKFVEYHTSYKQQYGLAELPRWFKSSDARGLRGGSTHRDLGGETVRALARRCGSMDRDHTSTSNITNKAYTNPSNHSFIGWATIRIARTLHIITNQNAQ